MGLTVFCDPCTVNSRKVLAGLQLLGTPYDFKKIDFFKGEQKSPEFTKTNPFQTVPAATDGDLVLCESNAIMLYAGDQKETAHYPRDPKQRAKVQQWLLWETSAWFSSCYIYLVQYVVQPLLSAQPDEKVIEAEAPRWNKFAKILDDQLGRTKWLVGDEPTIADIAVASPIHLWEACKMPLDKYPNLKRWMTEGVEKLECWKKTQPDVEAALLPNKK